MASSIAGGGAAKGSRLVKGVAGLLDNSQKAADLYRKARGAYDVARGCADPLEALPLMPLSLGRRGKSQSPLCFVAGTLILTTAGKKAIEELRLGDWVLSWDEETGEVIERPVTDWFQREASTIVDIFIGIEKISCTTDHPFWVQGKGWVLAFQLKAEMVLESREGKPLIVDAVHRRNEVTQVYNVEIDGLHTYFVSNLEILSHNACNNGKPPVSGIAPDPANLNWSPKSGKTFGHTFDRHGEGRKNTEKLRGRAAGTGKDQGQWNDNQKAAEYLKERSSELSGPASIRIPDGLGQVIKPDGSIVPAQWATVVPKADGGYRSGYPILNK